MSYPLSGVYHVTHGEANYQFLTAVFAKYQELDPDGRIKELNSFLSNVLECDADLVYVEIGKLLDQIIASGYDGYLSIEHFGSLDQLSDMERSAAYLKNFCL